MIHVNKKSLDSGSCNFCNRGEVSAEGLIFSYNYVLEITGESNLAIRICQECFDELTYFQLHNNNYSKPDSSRLNKEIKKYRAEETNYDCLSKVAQLVVNAWNNLSPDIILGDRINELSDCIKNSKE